MKTSFIPKCNNHNYSIYFFTFWSSGSEIESVNSTDVTHHHEVYLHSDASIIEEYLDRYPQLSKLKLSHVIFDGHKSYSFFFLTEDNIGSAIHNVFNPDLCIV